MGQNQDGRSSNLVKDELCGCAKNTPCGITHKPVFKAKLTLAPRMIDDKITIEAWSFKVSDVFII